MVILLIFSFVLMSNTYLAPKDLPTLFCLDFKNKCFVILTFWHLHPCVN